MSAAALATTRDRMAGHAGTFKRLMHRRPHAALEWDSSRKKIVAPKSQVGLSKAQSSKDGSLTRSSARLVDSFDIPKELLQLPNLSNLLSVEAWEHYLSETEREFLSTYLPGGFNSDYIVEALLEGDNFHFGNALQTWGEAVCAGAMHPDTILQREGQLKQERNAYLKRLSNYHGNMLQNLQKLKDVWEDCASPEDFLSHIQRRSMKPGLTIRANSVGKHAQRSMKRSADVAFPRVWAEGDEGVKHKAQQSRSRHLGGMSRSKVKKSNDSKFPEKGVEVLRAESIAGQFLTPNANYVEYGSKKKNSRAASGLKANPTRLHVKSGNGATHQRNEYPVVLTTGVGDAKRLKMNTSNEGFRKLPVGHPGVKRLMIKPLEERPERQDLIEEDSKRLYNWPLNGAFKRPPYRAPEIEEKEVQARVPDSRSKWHDTMLMANDEVKGLKLHLSGKGAKRLKVKSSKDTLPDLNAVADERGELSTELRHGGVRKSHGQPLDEDTNSRSKGKKQHPRASGEASAALKKLEVLQSEPATKKLHVKMDKGRHTVEANHSKGRDQPGRSKVKKEKASPADKTPKLVGKIPDGEKRRSIKSSADASNAERKEPSSEEYKVSKNARASAVKPQLKLPGGQKVASKSKDTQGHSPRILEKKRKSANVVPDAKRQKNEPEANGKGGGKENLKGKGNSEVELGGSDFEGDWFKKYVQVAVGPVSGQKISKAVQPVKVSSVLFQDVKRRTEAGEEVHLDTWHPEQEQLPTKSSAAGKETETIQKFWQAMACRDVPDAHVRFMAKKRTHHKIAMDLALSAVDSLAERSESVREPYDNWNMEWDRENEGLHSPRELSDEHPSGREGWIKENVAEAYDSGSEGYANGKPYLEGGVASGSEERAYFDDGQDSGNEDAWASGELQENYHAFHGRSSWGGAEEPSDEREAWAGKETHLPGERHDVPRSDEALSGDEEDMPNEGESQPSEADDVLFGREAQELCANGDNSPRTSAGGLQMSDEFRESPLGAELSLGDHQLLEGDKIVGEDGLDGVFKSPDRNGSAGRDVVLDRDSLPRRAEAFSSDNEVSDFENSPNRTGFQSEDEALASGDDDGM